MGRWRVLQGQASRRPEALVVNPPAEGIATVASSGKDMQDGHLELRVRRPAGTPADAPYTVALRSTPTWNWTSVYFVFRRNSLEVCRAAAWDPFPKPLARKAFQPVAAGAVEALRFVLAGPRIDCYRGDRRLISYQDPQPRSGRVALTADRCRLDILEVRFAPAGQ